MDSEKDSHISLLLGETQRILLLSKYLIQQLNSEEFSSPLEIIQNNSISQHFRHIIEFYGQLLIEAKDKLDYDLRKRSSNLESNPELALQSIDRLLDSIGEIQDRPMTLFMTLGQVKFRPTIQTSMLREIAYCNEHSIHHFALIRIAISNCFPHIELPSGLGIANSTQVYINSLQYRG